MLLIFIGIYIIGVLITTGILVGLEESTYSVYSADEDDIRQFISLGFIWPFILIYAMMLYPIILIGKITYKLKRNESDSK